VEPAEKHHANAMPAGIQPIRRPGIPVGNHDANRTVCIGDRVLMLENTWYSVISPESCSSILWRSWEHKEKAAEALKLTANDMMQHGLIDGIITEPIGGAHRNHQQAFENVKTEILAQLNVLNPLSSEARITQRIQKFSAMGVVHDLNSET